MTPEHKTALVDICGVIVKIVYYPNGARSVQFIQPPGGGDGSRPSQFIDMYLSWPAVATLIQTLQGDPPDRAAA